MDQMLGMYILNRKEIGEVKWGTDRNSERILFKNTFLAFFFVCEKFWMRTEKYRIFGGK